MSDKVRDQRENKRRMRGRKKTCHFAAKFFLIQSLIYHPTGRPRAQKCVRCLVNRYPVKQSKISPFTIMMSGFSLWHPQMQQGITPYSDDLRKKKLSEAKGNFGYKIRTKLFVSKKKQQCCFSLIACLAWSVCQLIHTIDLCTQSHFEDYFPKVSPFSYQMARSEK